MYCQRVERREREREKRMIFYMLRSLKRLLDTGGKSTPSSTTEVPRRSSNFQRLNLPFLIISAPKNRMLNRCAEVSVAEGEGKEK